MSVRCYPMGKMERVLLSLFFYKGGRGGGKGNFSLTLPIEWFRCSQHQNSDTLETGSSLLKQPS